MAWSTRWPVVNTDWMGHWPLVNELINGVQQRANLAALCDWPTPTKVFFDGFVIAATATTVTLSATPGGPAATFCVNGTPSGHVYQVPWFCIDDSPTSQNPGHNGAYPWFLNIDDNDPAKNISGLPIQSNTTAGVVTVPNMSDYWTSNQLTGTPFTSLIGKRATITGWGYALWWAARNWGSEWPNDREYAFGVVPQYTGEHDDAGTLLPDSPATSFMRDDTKGWTPNEHVGRDLLVYSATDGLLKRVTITSNTKNTLFWAAQTWVPKYGQAYCVVAAGARAYPGRQDPVVWAWTRTVREGFATHSVFNDGVGSVLMPVSTIPMIVGLPGPSCGTFNQPIYDYDYIIENPIEQGDLDCGTNKSPGQVKNPDLYKQIHGLQLACEDLSWLFCEAKDYTGINGLPKINPAEMFRLANINWQSVTTGNVVGASGDDGSVNNQINITGFTLPTGMAYPIDVHYSIRHSDGTLNGGYGLMLNATTLQGLTSNAFQQRNSTGPVEHDSGKTIIMSTGWTRFVFRRVKRLYTQIGFIPDYQIIDGVVNVYGTPTVVDFTHQGCTGVGSYQKRAPSDHYIERKQDGGDPHVRQGYAWDGTDASTAFNALDVAIYVGDGPFDPSISSSGAPETGHVLNEMAPFYDHFYNGLLIDKNQYLVNQQKGGAVTAGGTFYLQDTSKNWFDHAFFTVGKNGTRAETGTATSGSTTSLTDSTKVESNPSSPTNPLHCYWNASRFIGFTGSWVGFTVEVDAPDGHGGTITYKRLITAGNATTCTVSWNEPLPVSAAGLTYRIKEVYILNRWAERTLEITKADGSKVTTPIVGNCEDTIFFTPVSGLTVDNTMTYRIVEFMPGTTIQRDSANTKWQRPTGADVVRKGVTSPTNFVDPSENLAYIQKRHGRFMDRDIICPLIYNELYQVLNVLRWVRFAIDGWTANFEENYFFAAGDTDPIIGDGDACAKAKGLWGASTINSGSSSFDSAPFARGTCTYDGEYATSQIERQYAYANFTFGCKPIRFAISVDFWNKAVPYCATTSNPVCSFDAMGDAVANGTFVKWDAQGPTQTVNWRSAPLGSLATPNCPGCVDSGSVRSSVQGYKISEVYAVAKGDVVGGFTQINRTDGL